MPEPIKETPLRLQPIRKLKSRILRGVATLVLAGQGSLACSPSEDQSSQIPKPSPIEQTIPTIDQWRGKAAIERIADLEMKGFQLEGLDRRSEMISAMADFYCSSVPCRLTAADLKSKTQFLDADRFMNELAKEEKGVDINSESERNQRLEITSEITDKVFINEQSLSWVQSEIRTNSPDVVQSLELQGKDLESLVIKSVLSHAFTHFNIDQPEINIPGFGFKLPDGTDVQEINKLKNLTLRGHTSTGEPIFITGLNEAFADLVGHYVGTESGGYLALVPNYISGARLLNEINTKLGLTVQDAQSYIMGQKPFQEYLNLIESKAKEKARGSDVTGLASILLGSVGLHVQGFLDEQSVQQYITSSL